MEIYWDGDKLIQYRGDRTEELGHIAYDEESKDYVLWLKDTHGLLNARSGYIRAESFMSKEEAYLKTTSCLSTRILYSLWNGILEYEIDAFMGEE